MVRQLARTMPLEFGRVSLAICDLRILVAKLDTAHYRRSQVARAVRIRIFYLDAEGDLYTLDRIPCWIGTEIRSVGVVVRKYFARQCGYDIGNQAITVASTR